MIKIINLFRALISDATARIKIRYSKMYHLHEQRQIIFLGTVMFAPTNLTFYNLSTPVTASERDRC